MSVKIDALKSMASGISTFMKLLVKIVVTMFGALAILCVSIYIIAHYFLYVLGVVFILGMGFWFFIECQIAEQNLLYKEQSAKFVDKSNP